MFHLAIRNSPNYAVVNTLKVKSFDDVWKLFEVRLKNGSFSVESKFVDISTGKPANIYINPVEHSKDIIHKYTVDKDGRGCSMSFLDGKVRSSGTARKAGDWLMIEACKHPDYAQAKILFDQELKKKREIREHAERIEEEKHHRLEYIVDAHGIDKVLEALSVLN